MRGVTDVSGLREIRSLHTTGKRSIPGSQNSAYLDLYMLEKEKERLEKEAALLEKRSQAIRKRLGEIQRQAESLKKSASQPQGRKGKDERGGRTEQPWEEMEDILPELLNGQWLKKPSASGRTRKQWAVEGEGGGDGSSGGE